MATCDLFLKKTDFFLLTKHFVQAQRLLFSRRTQNHYNLEVPLQALSNPPMFFLPALFSLAYFDYIFFVPGASKGKGLSCQIDVEPLCCP